MNGHPSVDHITLPPVEQAETAHYPQYLVPSWTYTNEQTPSGDNARIS